MNLVYGTSNMIVETDKDFNELLESVEDLTIRYKELPMYIQTELGNIRLQGYWVDEIISEYDNKFLEEFLDKLRQEDSYKIDNITLEELNDVLDRNNIKEIDFESELVWFKDVIESNRKYETG